jgi:hypothetical protein
MEARQLIAVFSFIKANERRRYENDKKNHKKIKRNDDGYK